MNRYTQVTDSLPLEHPGRKTNRVIETNMEWIGLDGTATKGIYYLLEF